MSSWHIEIFSPSRVQSTIEFVRNQVWPVVQFPPFEWSYSRTQNDGTVNEDEPLRPVDFYGVAIVVKVGDELHALRNWHWACDVKSLNEFDT